MGQYLEMVAQVHEGQQAQAQHAQLDQAMTDAANDNDGVYKREFVTCMQQLHQSNSAAQNTL